MKYAIVKSLHTQSSLKDLWNQGVKVPIIALGPICCFPMLLCTLSLWTVPLTEHVTTVMFSMKNKLDISLGVSIGSSTLISIFGGTGWRVISKIHKMEIHYENDTWTNPYI